MFRVVHRQWVYISLSAWLIACAAVLGILISYANAGGDQGGLPAGWTPAPELDAPDDRAMLLVFAHPKCPCTRATMSAIERLQRDVPGTFATRVVFYEPADANGSWRETDLWARAGKLVDAKAIADPQGLLTANAGAVVSGCVALFDVHGVLRFWGGLTPSRGHEGESLGMSTIRSILNGDETKHARASVFGCDIIGSDDHSIGLCGGGGCDAGNHD